MNQMSGEQIPEIRQALWAQKPAFVRAAGFSVVIGFLMLAPSFYMLEVYDRVVNSRSLMTLAMLTLLLGLAYAVLELLQWARHGVLRQAAEGFDNALANRVYEAAFLVNLRGERHIGLRGLRDFDTVRDFTSGNLMAGLMDIPMALLLIGVIFWIDTVLGVFGLISALLQGGITFLNKQATGADMTKASGLNAQAQTFVQASLRNGEIVQAMGMSDALRRRWLKTQTDMLRHQARASDRAGVYSALSKYVQLVSSSLMLGLGSWLLLQGEFTGSTGLMLMASILAGRALAPLVQVIAGWRSVAGAKDAFNRLEILLDKIPARKAGLPLPPPKGVLRVEQVTAHAPGTRIVVLQGVSFGALPGKMLAIVGPSASGKSSLAHLLVGAWSCVNGTVRLDGVDVSSWNKQELGPHVGFLPQNVALFEGTIAENIARFGVPDPGRIEAAARQSGLHDAILGLPQGYETDVGAEGVVLSGGQRQRIGLARALYGNPRLVVLDEPDASLDKAGEAALIHALKTLRATGVTVVVITHRLSLLDIADSMLVLAEGQVRMFGPRDEVLAALQKSATPQNSPAAMTPALATA
ncbi:MAG: type I secretion system permease/ATPase [Zoogloeaceae bacterium]|jgi:ATP-binding cassette subfamily C exporter for protease/lipase|nr:type I secretion system permease/ATPase [Zoogloeaceae bacterium]